MICLDNKIVSRIFYNTGSVTPVSEQTDSTNVIFM